MLDNVQTISSSVSDLQSTLVVAAHVYIQTICDVQIVMLVLNLLVIAAGVVVFVRNLRRVAQVCTPPRGRHSRKPHLASLLRPSAGQAWLGAVASEEAVPGQGRGMHRAGGGLGGWAHLPPDGMAGPAPAARRRSG